jgi:hypothetical protein
MSDIAGFLSDAWVSLCAALGALIVLSNLARIVPQHALGRRYAFCLWLLFTLMLARIGDWGNWGWLFSTTANLCAAIMPLAVLLLAETHVRRHAPKGLKYFCAAGGVILGLLGFSTSEFVDFWRIGALLVFQVVALGLIAIFVLRRDRGSLSQVENQMIDRVSLSFLLILPFLISDFMRNPAVDIPVRMGGVAVLAVCWLAIGLNRTGLKKTNVVLSYLGVMLVTVGIVAMVSALTDVSLRTGMQIGAVVLSAIMLLAIWQAAIALRIEDRQHVVLRELAQAKGVGSQAGLELFRRATEAPQSILVTEVELQEMNIDSLRFSFEGQEVQQAESTQDEQLIWLFSRFNATHAIALNVDPLQIIMANTPDLVVGDAAPDTLGAIQRFASFMTKGGKQ